MHTKATTLLRQRQAQQMLLAFFPTESGVTVAGFAEESTIPPAVHAAIAQSLHTDLPAHFQVHINASPTDINFFWETATAPFSHTAEWLITFPHLPVPVWVRVQSTNSDWIRQLWHRNPDNAFTVLALHPHPALLIFYNEEYYLETFIFSFG